MAQNVLRIHCPKCDDELAAEHVHGGTPNARGGMDRRRRRVGCWNRCRRCLSLYEALQCSTAPAKRLRKAQKRLEAAGQLRLV